MSASHSSDPRLAEALAECGRLREENRQLRERMGIPQEETAPLPTAMPGLPITVTGKSTPDEKVKLFRNLFRRREDIYALRWEGRNGKTGYSPAYRKVWGNPLSKHPDKPKEYFPLTDQVIHDHLTGKLTAGIYSLLATKHVGFSPLISTRRHGRMTYGHLSIPAPNGKCLPFSNGHVPGTAVISGFSLKHRCPPVSPDNSVPPFSPGPWSGVINLVLIPTTASFQVRIRCQKAVLAISSPFRCSICHEVMATAYFSMPISIHTPTSGRYCRASGGWHLPKSKT